MATDLDLTDRRILNALQSAFPLAEDPFDRLGEDLGMDSSEVIDRIGVLKDKNVVRQIGAIFDTRRLGYRTVLVAMRLPDDKLGILRDNSAAGQHPSQKIAQLVIGAGLAVAGPLDGHGNVQRAGWGSRKTWQNYWFNPLCIPRR